MRTNVIQFLAIVASVFIVLSLLKMLSDSTEPVQNSGEVRENYYDNHPNNVRKPQVPVDSYEQLPDEIMEDQMIQNDSTEYFTDAAPEEVAVPVQQVAPVEEEPVVQEEVRPVASSSSNGNCSQKIH